MRKRAVLLSILLLGIVIRLAHTLTDHYLVIGGDSYYFLHLAESIQENTDPLFSIKPGISPLVGYLAKLTGLDVAVIIVPLTLYIITALILYFGIRRIYGPFSALGTVFVFSMIPHSYWITGAGHLDRDGLCVMLITILGVGLLTVPGKKWVAGIIGSVVLSFSLLWSWVGVIISFLIIAIILTLKTVNNWSGFVIHLLYWTACFGILMLIYPVSGLWDIAAHNRYEIPVGEAHGLTFIDACLFWHPVLWFAIACGLWVLFKRRNRADIIFITWLLIFLIPSFWVKRVIIFALPPLSIIGGVGCLYIFNAFMLLYRRIPARTVIVCGLLVLTAVYGSLWYNAYNQGTIDRLSVNREWQDAYIWIEENVPDNSRILCYPDRGYFLLGMTGREPVYYANPNLGADTLSRIYYTDDAGEVYRLIKETGADYFIYSMDDKEGQISKELSRYWTGETDPESPVIFNRGKLVPVYDRDNIIIIEG